MDFLNISKAIEQGVYDVMMWILFFPLTLCRMIFSPRRTLAFVREQSAADPDEAFSSAMRPALFLFISILIGSFITPSGTEDLAVFQHTELGKAIASSWTSMMAFHMIVSCLIPLVAAVLLDMQTPGPITRETLRLPFDQQCYIGAPSMLVLSSLTGWGATIGATGTIFAIVIASAWLIAVEYCYFHDNANCGPIKALGLTMLTLVVGVVLIVFTAIVTVGLATLAEGTP